MTITQPAADQLQITLEQSVTEVVSFMIFAALIGGALSFGGTASSGARMSTLLIALLLAGGWSTYALSSGERYTFDRAADQYIIARHTLLGNSEIVGSLRALARVGMEVGGADDDRRLVVLVEATGQRIVLPRRINTFSENEQIDLGRTLADFLGLPLSAAQ